MNNNQILVVYEYHAMKFADTNVVEGKGFITHPRYALGFLPAPKDSFLAPSIDFSNLPPL